ncbi:MAG: hypothetical protein NUW01_15855 [Gemmatimonadaceae bacterium]|nr:hypothetical protein [Gemmatimonadaceae bacterium]
MSERCCDRWDYDELHEEPFGQRAAVYDRTPSGVKPVMYVTHRRQPQRRIP